MGRLQGIPAFHPQIMSPSSAGQAQVGQGRGQGQAPGGGWGGVSRDWPSSEALFSPGALSLSRDPEEKVAGVRRKAGLPWDRSTVGHLAGLVRQKGPSGHLIPAWDAGHAATPSGHPLLLPLLQGLLPACSHLSADLPLPPCSQVCQL